MPGCPASIRSLSCSRLWTPLIRTNTGRSLLIQSLIARRAPAFSASGTAYAECGSGPPLLLLHGVGMRAEAFAPQISTLARKTRVIALDLPGHGHTPALGGTPDLGDFVDWFIGTVDELRLDKISLIGHSMGALIATGFAAECASRLNRIALLNGVHKRSPSARAEVLARADALRSGQFDRNAPFSRWFHPDEYGSYACQVAQHLLHTVDAAGYTAAYHAFACGDSLYADHWPHIACPALFITGDGDANSTPQMARQMANAAPNGRAVIIEGHRHMLNLTAPEQVNAILLEWLDGSSCQDLPASGQPVHGEAHVHRL